ncbi:MAG TPA: hypothetical protein VFK78_06345 [Gemmatimonadales bacterium]|nr:hypothetical protein [Gemmatimonadales bacterium]
MKLNQWTMGLLLLTAAASTARAQERRIRRADLPAAVRKTADAQSQGATVRGYSRETENGQVTYEVEMTVHGRGRDLSIALDGTIVLIEAEVPFDSLASAVRAGLTAKAGAGTITKVEALTKHGVLVAYEAQVRTGKKRSEVQVGPKGEPLDHEE